MGAQADFADTVALPPPDLGSAEPQAAELEFDEALTPEPTRDTELAPTLAHIGRYALKRPLGAGGLGTVYEAWDPMLSRAVAVKTLQFGGEDGSRTALDTLFLNEARAVAGLNHAHIVTVYDAGLSEHGVYIAMERLHGRDLRQALAQGWQPPPAAAAQIARRVADALAYAHERGVVHCDIKPANIFLSPRGKPTVLDFGIARAAHDASPSVLEGMVAGSPHYLAPEQLTGGTVDERVDVYALGVVLYEMLCGRKAFDGDTLDQISNAVLHTQPAPAHEVRPGVPRALSDIARRAMAAEPAQRHPSAHELARELRQWLDSRGDKPRHPAQARRRRQVLPWLAAGAAAVMVLGIGMAMRPDAAPPPPTLAEAAATLPASPVVVAPAAPTPALPADGTASDAGVGGDPEPAVAATAPSTSKPSRTQPRPRKPTPAGSAAKPAPVVLGTVQIAVSPWGEIEVDGRPVGLAPPLSKLELSAGEHRITVRNGNNPAYSTTVRVDPAKPVTVRHRFGS